MFLQLCIIVPYISNLFNVNLFFSIAHVTVNFLSLKSTIPKSDYTVHFDSRYTLSADTAYMLVFVTEEYFHIFLVNENTVLSDIKLLI